MKILVIGGSGLIGSKVVANLRQLGYEVLAGSPSTGINTMTGEGLANAVKGTQVVIDVSNSPSFEDQPCSTSLKPRAAICSLRNKLPASSITSHSP
jgi:nucleoside-diphosphate-sugar epimerase